MENLQTGDVVMANYNVNTPGELGFWYDFIIASEPKKVAGKWTVSARRVIIPEYELSEPITLKQKTGIPGPYIFSQEYIKNIILPHFHSYLNSKYISDTVTQENISNRKGPVVGSLDEEGGDGDSDDEWQPTHSSRRSGKQGGKRGKPEFSGRDKCREESENENRQDVSEPTEESGDVYAHSDAGLETGDGEEETSGNGGKTRKRKNAEPEKVHGAKRPRIQREQAGRAGKDSTQERRGNGALVEESEDDQHSCHASHDFEHLQDDLVAARGKKLPAIGQLLQRAEYGALIVDDMLSVLEWLALFADRLSMSACAKISMTQLSNMMHGKEDMGQTVALKDLVIQMFSMLLACKGAVPPGAEHLLSHKPGTAGILSAMLQQYASAVLGPDHPIACGLGQQDLFDLPANGKLQVLKWLLCDRARWMLEPVVTTIREATEKVQELNKQQREEEAQATATYRAKCAAIKKRWAGKQTEETRELKKAAAAHHKALVEIAREYAVQRRPHAAFTEKRQKLGQDRHGRQYYRLACDSGLFIAESRPSSANHQTDDPPMWRHCNARDQAEELLGQLPENGKRECVLKRRLEAEMEWIFRSEYRPSGKRKASSNPTNIKNIARLAAVEFFRSAFPKDKEDLETFEEDLKQCNTPGEIARLVLTHAEKAGYDPETDKIDWLTNTWSQVTLYFNHLRDVCRLSFSNHRLGLPTTTPTPPVTQPNTQKNPKTAQKKATVPTTKTPPSKATQKGVKQP
eukprot:comp20812_c0_seq2/m.27412 comp20812_c0_seq2/g.27412  ORF comp20812_c0_seq2/g.27412 comp20812_c0_seq2/m.27412 type:complete len:745 (-) comp20812_c0_seq2:496-2730(-)